MSDTSGTPPPLPGAGSTPLSGAFGHTGPFGWEAASAEVAKRESKVARALSALAKAAGEGLRALGGSTAAAAAGGGSSIVPIDPARSGMPAGRPGHMAAFASRMREGGRIASEASGGLGGGMFGQAHRIAEAGGSFGGFIAGQIATQVADAVSKSLSQRVDRGYQYSLAADKMSVMYQQMTGMSQVQVQNMYRQPLTAYRLGGVEGINTMLGMQARTGISAAGQARSVEALRTASGFSYGTEDITRMISTLGSPQVANRMFMTMGTSLYGIGGKQNDAMSVIQSAVRAAGLSDPRIAATALQQGSATRARLSFMGVPEDMQDMIIQYAQENVAFNKKGGRGMYDPSNRRHRAMMGIEDNFATQKEETDRLKMQREENFYSRQADNFSDLEKMTQRLTKMFGALEDKLSGLIGAKIGLGGVGGAVGGLTKSIGSGMLMAAALPGAHSIPLALGGIAALGLGTLFSNAPGGDPVGSTDTPMVHPGITAGSVSDTDTKAGHQTLSLAKKSSSFNRLHPVMQQRISRLLIAAGGRVAFGEGHRNTETQRTMFLKRHAQVTDPESIAKKDYDHFWDGKYWKLKPGNAPAAPPGKSMHEIGLAVDLRGDMNWVVENAARYGLKHFGNVNNEKWHVQPAELPDSRRKYEEIGSPWGTGMDPTSSDVSRTGSSETSTTFGTSSRIDASMMGKNISEIIESVQASNRSTLGSVSGAGGLSYGARSSTKSAALSGGVMSGEAIVNLMRGVGFSGDDLIKAVGITYRESRWNPQAINPVPPDRSYGLFQINMLDKPGYMLGESRRKRFNLRRNEELYDPLVNARSAKNLHSTDKWTPWRIKGSETNGVDMAAAAQTVREATTKTGDPYFPTRGPSGGGSTAVINGGTSITIAPEIHLHGGPSSGADLKRIANEVGKLLKHEVDIALLRSR